MDQQPQPQQPTFRQWARERIKMLEAELKNSDDIFDAVANTGHIEQLRCALKMLHLYERAIEQKRLAARGISNDWFINHPQFTTPSNNAQQAAL